MLKKFFGIVVFIFFLFAIENILFYFFGFWFKPNLILLWIIFLNLFLGIRYGLVASFCAGLLQDSFSTGAFGAHILSFIVCSYLIVVIRKYFLQLETASFRLAISGVVAILNVLVLYVINSFFMKISFSETVVFILFPEVLSTVLMAWLLFDYYKKCALKLFA
ncbi:MAG: rod shape-determining protein MreD [Candidatus Aceula meridiana]|nr:rod shape-determining protein MreD [Candidatus Aceula meridiana]